MICMIARTQQIHNICITFVQWRPNVPDVVPTLYKCNTNVLCLLGICMILVVIHLCIVWKLSLYNNIVHYHRCKVLDGGGGAWRIKEKRIIRNRATEKGRGVRGGVDTRVRDPYVIDTTSYCLIMYDWWPVPQTAGHARCCLNHTGIIDYPRIIPLMLVRIKLYLIYVLGLRIFRA